MKNCRNYIYLNNAATSWPKPPCVAEAVQQALLHMPEEGNRGGIGTFDVLEAVRQELALWLGVSKPGQIALGCNATWGLNQGIFGFPLVPGDWVLTTCAEHNAVLRPLHRLQNQGILVKFVHTRPAGQVDEQQWEAALKAVRPKLCIFTHASNVTGAVQNVETLTALAKSYGARVLLDVSQTLGWIPVELEKWGVDMAAFTGHKYLLGPQGTGGLYVSQDLTLMPRLLGGTGIYSDLEDMPQEMPLHLEAGTGNEPSFHGLLAAMSWSRSHPLDRKAATEKLQKFRQELHALGCQVLDPLGETTPVISFTIPGMTPNEAGYILRESYDIICRAGLHCAPKLMEDLNLQGGTIRFSLSRFTTEEEMEAALSAVKDLVESAYDI